MKIVFDVNSCLDCPACLRQRVEYEYGIALMHVFVNVCPECKGKPDEGPYIQTIMRQLKGRCVENGKHKVEGVPDWCPRLVKE